MTRRERREAAGDARREAAAAGLWNPEVGPDAYGATREKHQGAILEQYKLYVEMADRVSNRRGLTNTFFLTVNTAIFALVGVVWKDGGPHVSDAALVLLLVVALGQCAAWWWIVRSYRQLNGAKYMVVGLLEERLPARPYSAAEWVALGEGKDWRVYLPLTHAEQWVPLLFASAYGIGFALLVLG